MEISDEDKRKIDEKALNYSSDGWVDSFTHIAKFGYELGYHSRDAEVERLKQQVVELRAREE